MALTWNVEGFNPKKTEYVAGLFDPVIEHRPHIVVISLEEIFEMKMNNFSKILSNSSMPEEAKAWENQLTAALQSFDNSYKRLETKVNGGVMMIVFSNLAKEDISIKKASKINLGSMGGMLANKGAVLLNLTVKRARLQFVACHLESGEGDKHNAERLSQLQSIAPAAISNNRIDDPKVKVFLSYQVSWRVRQRRSTLWPIQCFQRELSRPR